MCGDLSAAAGVLKLTTRVGDLYGQAATHQQVIVRAAVSGSRVSVDARRRRTPRHFGVPERLLTAPSSDSDPQGPAGAVPLALETVDELVDEQEFAVVATRPDSRVDRVDVGFLRRHRPGARGDGGRRGRIRVGRA